MLSVRGPSSTRMPAGQRTRSVTDADQSKLQAQRRAVPRRLMAGTRALPPGGTSSPGAAALQPPRQGWGCRRDCRRTFTPPGPGDWAVPRTGWLLREGAERRAGSWASSRHPAALRGPPAPQHRAAARNVAPSARVGENRVADRGTTRPLPATETREFQ